MAGKVWLTASSNLGLYDLWDVCQLTLAKVFAICLLLLDLFETPLSTPHSLQYRAVGPTDTRE